MKRPEAVRFTLHGNELLIEATLRFSDRALAMHPDLQVAYADLIESGIRRVWTKAFLLDETLLNALRRYAKRFAPRSVLPGAGELFFVRTILYRDKRHGMAYGPGIAPPSRALPVRLGRSALLPSRVGSPFWRRGWGIFRVRQLEGLGLNWTRASRGRMTMAPYRHVWQIEPVAAHEFGHLLGLGDAYGAIYRYYSDAPGTENYLMRNNGALSAEEMAMVLDAERLNKMQFFPKRFHAAQFKAGFKKEVERIKKQARKS